MLSQAPDRVLTARQFPSNSNTQWLHDHYPVSNPKPLSLSPLPASHSLIFLSLEPSTYKDLLQFSAKTQSLIRGRLVYSHMIRTSYRPGLILYNNLRNMYCKRGDLSTANQLFDKMLVRDVVTWNSLMAGYSEVAYVDKALDEFAKGRKAKIKLDRISYASALSACGDHGDAQKGRIVHGLVVVSGLASRAFLTDLLIDMYSKCGRIDDVRLVFDHAEELDEVSWNSLLSAYVRVGWPEVATNILVWMHRSGVKLNSFALGSILKACSGFNDSEEVQKMLHGCVVKVGLDLDIFVGSAMLDVYAKNGGLEEAIKVFECIPNPSVVLFNALIAGFSRLGTKQCNAVRFDALRLFSEMLRRRMRPSKFTFSSVLEACNLIKAFKCGKQIHAHIITNDLQDDEFAGSSLITLYSNMGQIEDSFRCFHATSKKDIFTWTSMISACVLNKHFERALSLFNELLGLGIKPDQFAISTIMRACSNLGILRIGEQIQGFAMKAGLDQFTVCGNSQINMYSELGDINAAIRTSQNIGSLDVVSWSTIISSHALLGCATDAIGLFEKMMECMVTPNDVTFLAVLTACSHGGLVDEGFRYFERMRTDYGLAPNVKHCTCLVDLLGRAGRLVDAENFISSSGFDNDPSIWHALLRACQFHGDIERGIRAGEKLMVLEPFSATSYMLLYNMYLDAGKVSLAMRTRGLMRERGVNKEIGMSWIEIGASVHSFVAGNNSHPQINAIYAKLEVMLFNIKQRMRYAGVKILELEYKSEKWKDRLMNSHGELLAVALGMCCLPDSIPVRVMKNQRVCEDCHTTLKLISESERREIVLRDPVRFHHFSWGSCSCGNYW
ncbi:pentatricopeptide repeat-containing protein At3g13880-like [Phoenix dactylifera]|uniref:Pentatricopeptide repeat-containing protein At3g13880-like n=1 Tax=Phoenix dactylifera TaxID=42345 RepID=A0A8B7CPZ0_PHODC|nr:pentatricopeptide repeat-containing protein At3g13880-like [Phoenix dactylifera]